VNDADESPLLDGLNPTQREAVLYGDGPLLLFAGAGSGKTRVLTHRIAHLILERGVRPRNVLAVTFTNKAAKEMRERLEKLVGSGATKELWAGTFHSTCARLLRERGDSIGLPRDFVVYDDDDQLTVIKECLHQLNLDDRQYAPRAVLSFISRAKEKLIEPEHFKEHFSGLFENVVARIYTLYQEKLSLNHALDFDDLIGKAVRMLQQREDVREYYQNKFKYVLVDEYQDVNMSQYKLTQLLSDGTRNICIVGDDDQCLPPATPISVPNGFAAIETLEAGDFILATGGDATLKPALVSRVHKSHYSGDMFEIKTDGVQLRGTPGHRVFARLSAAPGQERYFVYLMYRSDRGYRVGMTKASRRGWKGGEAMDQVGFIVRSNQEHADKMWILKSVSTFGEARFWEEFFAARYGLPTMVFHSTGRSTLMGGDEWIERLYDSLDTEAAAKRLMEELHLESNFPHHRPQGGARRQSVTFTMFGGYRTSRTMRLGDHRIQWCARRPDLAEKLQEEGFPVRPSKLSGFKMETCRVDYRDAVQLARRAAAAGDMEVSYRARVAGETYQICPLSHVHPGMHILVEENGILTDREVQSVEKHSYDGPVYDLEVDDYHCYVSGGMLVHNSVYGWRGADIEIILGFESDYPDAKIIKLEQNYRSTKTILEAAYAVVSRNRGRKDKKLWTQNPDGEAVLVWEAMNEQEEAVYVAQVVREALEEGTRRYSDFAILYRTNAQSRVLEEVFINYRIPYQIVGGVRFYERREIKDLMAYLRLIHNPFDSVSLKRIVNVPTRGIGATSWARIEETAQRRGVSLWDAIADLEGIDLKPSIRKAIQGFTALIVSLRSRREQPSVTKLVEAILEETGYKRILEADKTVEAQSRLENVQELLTVTQQFEHTSEDPTLRGFLEQTALIADIDSLGGEGADAVVLMTLHSAKGLEFPEVFLVGLEESIFPHFRTLQDDKSLEEERRLAYVGITRARERLHLTFAARRTIFGNIQINPPSRFVRDIPLEHLAVPAGGRIPGFARTRQRELHSYTGGPAAGKSAATPATPPKPTTPVGGASPFKPGEKVKHAVFGQGVVVGCTGMGDDAQVTVAFPNVGVKKLVAGYARLEKAG
jgi:DNA helicase II / ATP-dependent DNA helicase PcrA